MPILPGLADQYPKLKNGQCKHIYSKEMFYETERESVDYESRIYWCGHTQTCLGPDNMGCDMAHCNPDRSCFETI